MTKKVITFPKLQTDKKTFGELKIGDYYKAETGELRLKRTKLHYSAVAGKYGALVVGVSGISQDDTPIDGYFEVNRIVFNHE